MDEHELFEVVAFKVLGDHTLWLKFDDGVEQIIDFEPVLYGTVFAPLRDPSVFRQVQLNTETGTVEWPTGADFDPETLHNWHLYRDRVIARRQTLLAAR